MTGINEGFAPANEGVLKAHKAEREAMARMAASKAAHDAAKREYDRDRALVREMMNKRDARKFTDAAGHVIVTLTEVTNTSFDRELLFKLAPKAAQKALKVSVSERLNLGKAKG